MPDLTPPQRAEVIELIEAIYSHDGAKPECADTWIPEHAKYMKAKGKLLDLQAFVGVWVPWLGDYQWTYMKQPALGSVESETPHQWWGLSGITQHPNFILATARAVRAQQTGGA